MNRHLLSKNLDVFLQNSTFFIQIIIIILKIYVTLTSFLAMQFQLLLEIDELNVDNSTKIYLDKINMFLDTYATLKRINKYKLKFKSKPWITLGLQKSISVKNKLLTNFINKKDPVLKEEFHTKYKKYRNFLSTLMKKIKKAYYDKYFERN